LDDQLEIVARIEANARRSLELEDVVELEADVEVDNDNEPAIKNKPAQTTKDKNNCTYSEWGHNGMCPRRMAGVIDPQPTLQISTKPAVMELFKCFFPV
jgi:hypothetical protein